MAVNLSQFSIRYPEFPKYVWDSRTPYSDLMQIKKDRRNPEHTKRPLNAFMLFAKIQREFITSNCSCNHSEISKALGKLWQELSKEEKEPFIRGGKTLVELHRIEFPDYKYRPKKKGQSKDTSVKTATAASAKKVKTECNRVAKSTTRSMDSPVQRSIKEEPTSHQHQGYSEAPQRPQAPESPLGQNQCFPAGSPTTSAAPASPFSYGSLSPSSAVGVASSPDSGLGMTSPASQLHTPCSPASCSGDDSEMFRLELGVPDLAALYEKSCWSPMPEPDMANLDLTPLDDASLLNPLAMFPVLDINSGDLDYLEGLQWSL